jgi:uncharacterized membrane protein (DUF2068 family)
MGDCDRRSGWVTGVKVIQLLIALTLAGTTIFLLYLTKSPEILAEKDAAETVGGLHIAAALCGPLAIVYLVSVFGLWKEKLWGWWLAFLLNAAAALALMFDVINDGFKNVDTEDVVVPVILILIVVVYLLPAVRKYYWNSPGQKSEALAAAPNNT